MKRIFLPILIVLLTAGMVLAEPAEGGKGLSVRTFQFKYKDVDRAAAIIKPLLSAQGSISMQPSERSLVVTDRADNIAAIASALSEFDTAPRPLKLSIRLVMASRTETPARVPDELRDVAPKLAMLRYNSVESLGAADIESREGDSGSVELANGFRAEFRMGEYDPASKSVTVTDFKLSKVQDSQLKNLYKTTLNLKVGQTLILAATRQGQRAVVVVLAARK
jgi:Bacterial type II/III secretion system short domain